MWLPVCWRRCRHVTALPKALIALLRRCLVTALFRNGSMAKKQTNTSAPYRTWQRHGSICVQATTPAPTTHTPYRHTRGPTRARPRLPASVTDRLRIAAALTATQATTAEAGGRGAVG